MTIELFAMFRGRNEKPQENGVACRLLIDDRMDAAEFDRLVARARDPRLIPGIYNYCDGRCARCGFTQRCLTFLDSQEAAGGSERSIVEAVGEPLQRTLGMIAEAARRAAIDVAASPDEALEPAVRGDLDRHRQDPLAIRARAVRSPGVADCACDRADCSGARRRSAGRGHRHDRMVLVDDQLQAASGDMR